MSAAPTARAVTAGPRHHFFGYYDKFPWNAGGRYLLGLETTFFDRPPTAADVAVVGMVDLEAGNRWIPLAETRAWNWQQGTMLQWLGSDPEGTILFNLREEERFAAVLLQVQTGARRVLPRPVYAASRDGRQALSVNFARIAANRPGYGYAGLPDPWAEDPHPAEDGIHRMDLGTGEYRLVVSLDQVVGYRPKPGMAGPRHWFNHLQFNPSGTRFLFLHRWVEPGRGRLTRLFTADPDGGRLRCLADHDLVSHFDWRDDTHVLAWARQPGIGDRFFLFPDREGDPEIVGDGLLTEDGHCSYSPDGGWLMTDTYPDRVEGKRRLLLYDLIRRQLHEVDRFWAIPDRITGEIRCDLHPRWSRDGRQVCFDSVHEGSRQIYVVDVDQIVDR